MRRLKLLRGPVPTVKEEAPQPAPLMPAPPPGSPPRQTRPRSPPDTPEAAKLTMEQRVRLRVEDQLVEEELARRRAERDATSSKAAPPAPPPVPEEPRQRQRQQSEWRYPWATSVLHIVDPDTEQRLERSQLREVAPDRELQCAVYTELALPPVSGRRHDVTYTEASATQWVGAKLEVGTKKGSVDVEARLVGHGYAPAIRALVDAYHSYGRTCRPRCWAGAARRSHVRSSTSSLACRRTHIPRALRTRASMSERSAFLILWHRFLRAH